MTIKVQLIRYVKVPFWRRIQLSHRDRKKSIRLTFNNLHKICIFYFVKGIFRIFYLNTLKRKLLSWCYPLFFLIQPGVIRKVTLALCAQSTGLSIITDKHRYLVFTWRKPELVEIIPALSIPSPATNMATRYPSDEARVSAIRRSLNRGHDCAAGHVAGCVRAPLFDRWTSIVEIVFWLANNRHWANVASVTPSRFSASLSLRLTMTARTGNKPRHNARAIPLLTETSRILLLCGLCTRHSPVRSYSWRGNADRCEIRARGEPARYCFSLHFISRFSFLPLSLFLSFFLSLYVSLLAVTHTANSAVSPHDYHGSFLTGLLHCARHARWLIARPRWLIGCRLLGKVHSVHRIIVRINDATNVFRWWILLDNAIYNIDNSKGIFYLKLVLYIGDDNNLIIVLRIIIILI